MARAFDLILHKGTVHEAYNIGQLMLFARPSHAFLLTVTRTP